MFEMGRAQGIFLTIPSRTAAGLPLRIPALPLKGSLLANSLWDSFPIELLEKISPEPGEIDNVKGERQEEITAVRVGFKLCWDSKNGQSEPHLENSPPSWVHTRTFLVPMVRLG